MKVSSFNSTSNTLVLDTYALVEIREGNLKFASILLSNFVIPDFILAEFYILLWKDSGEAEAETWDRKLSNFSSKVGRKNIIEALKYRNENKKDNLSIFDSIGYTYALENGFTFVTGDKAFRNKKGVWFIQK